MRNTHFRFPHTILTAIFTWAAIAVLAAPQIQPAPGFDLKTYQGKVLVLEIGQIGCPKSQEGLATLEKLRQDNLKSKDLALVFVQASKNEEALKGFLAKGSYGFEVFSDPQGQISRQFSYQAVPTFYLIGKEGEIRYWGPWNGKKWPEMLAAVRAEKPGAKKNYFLEETVAPGARVPVFSLKGNRGGDVSTTASLKNGKLLLLLFGDDKCPFSRAALAKLPALEKRFAPDGLKTLVVHIGAWNAGTAAYYASMKLPCPVGLDESEKVADLYAIKAVPTVLLVQPNGVIYHKALYSPETDRTIEAYLKSGGNVAPPKPPAANSSGAGKG